MNLLSNYMWRQWRVLCMALLGLLLAGCGSTKYSDPINPKNPYMFPGQLPTADSALPSVAPVPAGPTSAVPTVPAIAPAPTTNTQAPVLTPAVAPTPVAPVPAPTPGTGADVSSSLIRVGDTIVISFSDLPPPGLSPVTI